jgi:adenylosuccinate synthase
MVTTIVVGGFFGDEGKGKIVAHIAYTDHPSIIARGGVGPNAGHTVIKDGVKHGVRMIPSGFIYDKARLLIGAGVLVDPNVLDREVTLLHAADRLGVDYRCSIIEQKHIEEDKSTSTGTRRHDGHRLRPRQQGAGDAQCKAGEGSARAEEVSDRRVAGVQ